MILRLTLSLTLSLTLIQNPNPNPEIVSEVRNRNLKTLGDELRKHLEVILGSHAHQPHPAPPEMDHSTPQSNSWSRTMATESRPAFSIVDWRDSKVGFLEKLIEYESVHPMDGFEDLQDRLSDGSCIAYLEHPTLPGEPLIYFEFALRNEVEVKHIGQVLRKRAVGSPYVSEVPDDIGGREVNTALLYGVNVGHAGLRGLDLGSFLVKQAFTSVRQQHPEVKKFVTLSPIMGFKAWLEVRLARACRMQGSEGQNVVLEWNGYSGGGSTPELVLTQEESENLMSVRPEAESPMHALRYLLGYESSQWKQNSREWHDDQDKVGVVKEPLTRWCVEYLTTANHLSKDRSQDAALNFHMRNGAQLDDVFWGGDDYSKVRWDQSFGMMCKYEYFLDDVENNNYRYVRDRHVITSETFRAKFPPPMVFRPGSGILQEENVEVNAASSSNLN